MALKQPIKGLRLGQLAFNAWHGQPPLQPSRFQPCISVDDYAVSRDHERFSKGEVTPFNDSRQFGCWNREIMPNVTWVWTELVRSTKHDVSLGRREQLLVLHPRNQIRVNKSFQR